MQFYVLASILQQIEQESARLKITHLLASLWQNIETDEIRATVNLIEGQLKPAYESLEFNLSEKMITRCLAKLIQSVGGLSASGVALDLFNQVDDESILKQIHQIHRRTGDWGETGALIHQDLWPNQMGTLTINEVYQKLMALALIGGIGSQEKKLLLLGQLLAMSDSQSAKIIIRIVIGKLRLGFSTMTIIDSLSWAVAGNKSENKLLEDLYQKKADLGLLAQSYLTLKNTTVYERQLFLQKNYHLEVGVPVVLALCQRLNSSQEIIAKMPLVLAEPKYDGMRIQIHYQKTASEVKIKAFTRNLENVTAMLPELQQLSQILTVDNIILDSEAVAYDRHTGTILPFQEMMTRRRKHQIAQKSQEIPIKFYIFDVLYLNQQEYLEIPLEQRKKTLAEVLPSNQHFVLTPYIITDDQQKLRAYHQEQLKNGLEGMIAKGLQSVYQSGRKGWHWVKIKEEEGTRGKLNDTLDLVVMGLYAGKGKRHAFGVGAFLVGVRNQAGEFLTISKIGTGLSDDALKQLNQRAQTLQVNQPPNLYQVTKNLKPDRWLRPHLVAEVVADEISKSAIHTSGYSLRFPRLLRWRDDKNPEQATTLEELKQIKVAT